MGQCWDIVNITAGQRHSAGKLGEFMWNFEGYNLVYLFAKPVKPPRSRYIPPESLFKSVHKIDGESLCPILSVPDEILLRIFEELDFVSTLRLILASQRFFRVGWGHLEREMREAYGLWVGHPVICVGEYCDIEDMPQGFLTDEEKQVLKKGPAKQEINEEDGVIEGPANLYHMAGLRFADVGFEHPYDNLHFWTLINRVSSQWLSAAQQAFAKQVFKRDFFDFFPVTENWILRDLTCKEYVRGDGLFNAFQDSGQPVGLEVGHWKYPGFMDAILSRICWSSDTSTAPLPRMQKGPWAGHAFEICTESEHILESTEAWVDVTQAVVEDLALIHDIKIRSHEKKRKRKEKDDDRRVMDGL